MQTELAGHMVIQKLSTKWWSSSKEISTKEILTEWLYLKNGLITKLEFTQMNTTISSNSQLNNGNPLKKIWPNYMGKKSKEDNFPNFSFFILLIFQEFSILFQLIFQENSNRLPQFFRITSREFSGLSEIFKQDFPKFSGKCQDFPKISVQTFRDFQENPIRFFR